MFSDNNIFNNNNRGSGSNTAGGSNAAGGGGGNGGGSATQGSQTAVSPSVNPIAQMALANLKRDQEKKKIEDEQKKGIEAASVTSEPQRPDALSDNGESEKKRMRIQQEQQQLHVIALRL